MSKNFSSQKLGRYLKIDRLVKELTRQKEVLRSEILIHDGEFPSTYMVKISEFKRTQIESLEAIKDKSEKLYNAIIAGGCVREVEQKRLTVKKI